VILQIETKISEESAKNKSWCPLCGGSLVGLPMVSEVKFSFENLELKKCENCGLLFAK